MDLKFIKHLIRAKKRVFTTQTAREIGQEVGIDPNSIRQLLHRLKKKGAIKALSKGLYCLSHEFVAGIPIHEYEIGIALAAPSAIAFLSAMHYHNLTDQLSRTVYVLSVSDSSAKASYASYKIQGITYRIIRTKSELFFGTKKVIIGEAPIIITDLERTLIDGITRPSYCGGFREVLHAYSIAIDRINLDKIVSYAQRISDATCKRLGWILSHLEVEDVLLEPLLKRSSKSYAKLDSAGPNAGPWNKKWHVRENL